MIRERPEEAFARARREGKYPEQIEYIMTERIVRGVMIGEGPSEGEIAAEFGVSKPVVREVCARLVARGLVKVQSGKRMQITDRTSWDWFDPILVEVGGADLKATILEQLLEVRRIVEPETARRAASLAKAPDLLRMRQLVAEMHACEEDSVRYVGLDTEFHAAIADATQNDLLAHVVRSLRGLQIIGLQRTNLVPGGMPAATKSHERILMALESGSGEHAATEMMRHHELATNNLTKKASK